VSAEFDTRYSALRSSLYDPQAHTSVVNQELTVRLEDREHFAMGQTQVCGVAEPLVEGEPYHRTRFERDPAAHHGAKAELRSLQIGQNSNGPRQGTLDVADRLHIASQGSVISMTHIDAEDVGTRFAQAADQV
jgi:hypothetical protein